MAKTHPAFSLSLPLIALRRVRRPSGTATAHAGHAYAGRTLAGRAFAGKARG